MASLFFIRFMKTLMVTMPFFIMMLMVLALWGIGGKTTYTDLMVTKPQMELADGQAKNLMVKGSSSQELTSMEVKPPKINAVEEQCPTTKKDSLPEKIAWELVV